MSCNKHKYNPLYRNDTFNSDLNTPASYTLTGVGEAQNLADTLRVRKLIDDTWRGLSGPTQADDDSQDNDDDEPSS